MTRDIEWRAVVTFAHDQPPAGAAGEALVGALPGFGIVAHDGQRLRLEMTVAASTLRQATELALRTARAAYGQAYPAPAEPVGVEVLTVADHLRRIEHPGELELLGMTEIADLLGVTRQRARELHLTHPDFPKPVAKLAAGLVFTRESVEAFNQRWERRRTGRPPKTKAS